MRDAPQRAVLSAIVGLLLILGFLAVSIGLVLPAIVGGTALIIGGCVLWTGGLVVLGVRAALCWWEWESRQQSGLLETRAAPLVQR